MLKKIAFVTGASKGIGASIAENLSKSGYDVIIHYNTNAILANNLKIKLETEYQNNIYLIQGNLNDEQDINKIIDGVKSITNHLDVLINNAALSLDSYFLDKTKQEFMDVLSVNLIAPFLLVRSLKDVLNGGVVINISSTDAIDTGNIYNIDYSASKAGLITLTKILGEELNTIRFYSIAPNWVKTESIMEMEQNFLRSEMIRVGQKRLILPEEVAIKVIEIINNKDLKSGSIIRLDGKNE